MAKRKSRSKRSAGRLPKGLPVRPQQQTNSSSNPFETVAHNKRPKHAVHNRDKIGVGGVGDAGTTVGRPASSSSTSSALARALERRKAAIKEQVRSSKKANAFVDHRIGEYDADLTRQQKQIARLVKERTKRSKRSAKYSLNDNDDDNDGNDNVLTHKGKAVNKLTAAERDDDVLLSDDDDVYGDREAQLLDTDLHFGGGAFGLKNSKNAGNDAEYNPYGPAPAAAGAGSTTMADLYSQRKLELDDIVKRRKLIKLERQKSKERQVEVFSGMDESFRELTGLLKFRDKGEEARKEAEALRVRRESGINARKGTQDGESEGDEMEDWDQEMKQYQFMERKVKAADRTKTDDEIAAEEAATLHKLETRRLARMNGDFEDDDLADISDVDDSDNEGGKRSKKKQKLSHPNKDSRSDNPEALDDNSDNDDGKEELTVRFTADGLVEVDKNGVIVRKVGETADPKEEERDSDDDDGDKDKHQGAGALVLEVGTRVSACYRADEQFRGLESWYDGVVTGINRSSDGSGVTSYDIEYDDGDVEEGVNPRHVKIKAQSKDDIEKQERDRLKRHKAKEKAK